MLLNKRTYLLADIIGEQCLVRLFVATAHENMILMGRSLAPPIRHDFRNPCDTVLPDGEEEFSDDNEGEEWRLSD